MPCRQSVCSLALRMGGNLMTWSIVKVCLSSGCFSVSCMHVFGPRRAFGWEEDKQMSMSDAYRKSRGITVSLS
jgi:hypothetical protein